MDLGLYIATLSYLYSRTFSMLYRCNVTKVKASEYDQHALVVHHSTTDTFQIRISNTNQIRRIKQGKYDWRWMNKDQSDIQAAFWRASCALSWIFWATVRSFIRSLKISEHIWGCWFQFPFVWHLLLVYNFLAAACWGFNNHIVHFTLKPCRRNTVALTPLGTILTTPQLESRAASCSQDPCLSFWRWWWWFWLLW